MPSAWLRRNVFHPCEGGPLLRTIYLATLVWPISMPSLRSSPWIRGAPHNGLAMLISRISRRISNNTVGRPQRFRDFQRQYDLKPARCQRMTVSGFTIVSALMAFGTKRYSPTKIAGSIAEHMIDGCEHRSGDCADGLFGAAAGAKAVELGVVVAVLLAHGRAPVRS